MQTFALITGRLVPFLPLGGSRFLFACQILVVACLAAACEPARPEGNRQRIAFLSTADGTQQPAYLITPNDEQTLEKPVPLVVSLHTWSEDYEQRQEELEQLVLERGWLYLFPDFRGPNETPAACGSALAQQDILDAVDWTVDRYPIDETHIFLTGASGGGYMTLLMAGRYPERWAAASAWVGISDLAAWHELHAEGRFGEMMRGCFDGAPEDHPEIAAAYRDRSPLAHLQGIGALPLDIAAGRHDGHTGSVPIAHSLRAFNVIADALGAVPVTENEIDELSRENGRLVQPLASDTLPDPAFGRALFLRRWAGATRVTIFEGGHESLPPATIDWFIRHIR